MSWSMGSLAVAIFFATAWRVPSAFAVKDCREGLESFRRGAEYAADGERMRGSSGVTPLLQWNAAINNMQLAQVRALLSDSESFRTIPNPLLSVMRTLSASSDAIERQGRISLLSEIARSAPESLDAVDEQGNTPLHLAIQFHYLDTLAPLLNLGANLKKYNAEGNTPLDIALLREDLQALIALWQALQVKGAPNIPLDQLPSSQLDKEGAVPLILHYAVCRWDRSRWPRKDTSSAPSRPHLEMLIWQQAVFPGLVNTLGVDDTGENALHIAVHRQDTAAVKVLTSGRAPTALRRARNLQGSTPLDLAKSLQEFQLKEAGPTADAVLRAMLIADRLDERPSSPPAGKR